MDHEACQFCGAAHTKMCLIGDKLFRFCCQQARSLPPVAVLNIPPCINESDTEDESDTDETMSQSDESDDDL